MKQKIYIITLISALIILAGTLFKVNHWPGAGILLTIGISTLVLVSLPAALINNYMAERKRNYLILYFVTWLTCFIVFTAMLFKIMHWPGAGTLILISLPFPFLVFLPVFLVVTSKIENFNIYNTVNVLFLLVIVAVFSALLALGVSRTRIDNSLALSVNYNRVEKSLRKFCYVTSKVEIQPEIASVNKKIDEILFTVNECQTLLYKKAGTTEEQWDANPGDSGNLDSRQIAQEVLLVGSKPNLASRLESGLRSYVKELKSIPQGEELAGLSVSLFELTDPANADVSWTEKMFSNNYLSWVLIYLDSLEVNLLSIKALLATS